MSGAAPFTTRRAFGMLQMAIAAVGLLVILFWRDSVDPLWLFLIAFTPTAVEWAVWPQYSDAETPARTRLLGLLFLAVSVVVAADLAGVF